MAAKHTSPDSRIVCALSSSFLLQIPQEIRSLIVHHLLSSQAGGDQIFPLSLLMWRVQTAIFPAGANSAASEHNVTNTKGLTKYNPIQVLLSCKRPSKESTTLLRTLRNLTQTCTQLRSELTPFLAKHTDVVTFGIMPACFFAESHFAQNVKNLTVRYNTCPSLHQVDELGNKKASGRRRWLMRLLSVFPNLEFLELHGFHQHQYASTGSRYTPVDLELMQMVLDNSGMEIVVRRLWQGTALKTECSMLKCDPTVLFGNKDGSMQRHFAPHYNYVEIDIKKELAGRADASKGAKEDIMPMEDIMRLRIG